MSIHVSVCVWNNRMDTGGKINASRGGLHRRESRNGSFIRGSRVLI